MDCHHGKACFPRSVAEVSAYLGKVHLPPQVHLSSTGPIPREPLSNLPRTWLSTLANTTPSFTVSCCNKCHCLPPGAAVQRRIGPSSRRARQSWRPPSLQQTRQRSSNGPLSRAFQNDTSRAGKCLSTMPTGTHMPTFRLGWKCCITQIAHQMPLE